MIISYQNILFIYHASQQILAASIKQSFLLWLFIAQPFKKWGGIAPPTQKVGGRWPPLPPQYLCHCTLYNCYGSCMPSPLILPSLQVS